MNKYKTIDLFAGIGGIRRGFEMTESFENVLSAEIDKYACQTYEWLFGENPCNDVTSEFFKQKVCNTDYEVLLAGFPCQAFSIAGKKEGFKDKTRGTLFFDVADILDRTRPRAFLLENVEGLIRHKQGQTFQTILETLTIDLNYKVIGVQKNPVDGVMQISYDPKSFVLNSRNFGVPQNRPRVYIMGFDEQKYGNVLDTLPVRELPKKSPKQPIYKDLNDLLEFNAEPEYYLAEGYLETLKKHRERHQGKGNGYGYIVVNEKNIINPVSNAILATGGSGKERNLVYDFQDGIAGLEVKGKHSALNSEGIRFMKPSEWGKLQGFVGYGFIEKGVDKFSFPPQISKGQQYKQFGNSVTIPTIEVLAGVMKECLTYLDEEIHAQGYIKKATDDTDRNVAL